jgi:hypothetical protein
MRDAAKGVRAMTPIDKTLYEFAAIDRCFGVAACGDRAAEALAARARWARPGSSPVAAAPASRFAAALRRPIAGLAAKFARHAGPEESGSTARADVGRVETG